MVSQGLPKIKGYPPKEVLGCRIVKSAGYSHESTEITTSSMMPFGLIVYMSASWSTVGVSLRLVSPEASMVSHFIKLMVAQRPINVFLMSVLLICTLTIELLGIRVFGHENSPCH
jgi:hypothetical protein